MANALKVYDDSEHAIPKTSRLAKSERELAEALVDQFEAFYKQGVILERIKDEHEFQVAGFSSFDEYMNQRQPLGIGRARAWQLIAAKKVRPLLPEVESTRVESEGDKPIWTEKAIRPLTHKDFTPSDQKRIGKKIATRVKKGEPLTANLVKEICDADRGVDKAKQKKKAEKIAKSDTPSRAINRMAIEVDLWLSSLGEVPGDFWEMAEEDDPGCVDELISNLSELVKFLRS